MAARTGAGTGVVVSLVVFVLAAIFLLILTIVFYARQADALAEAQRLEEQMTRVANAEQRNRDEWKAIMAEAAAARQTAFGYLAGERQALIARLTGDPATNPETVDALLAEYGVDEGESVVGHLRQVNAELRRTQGEVETLRAQVDNLEELVEEKDAQLARAAQEREEAVAAVNEQVGAAIANAEEYGRKVDEAIVQIQGTIDELESRYTSEIQDKEGQIDELTSDLAVVRQQLDRVREAYAANRPSAQNPATLVDAQIIDTVPSQSLVYLDRGREDRLTQGMTFEVYDDSSAITVDPVTGQMLRGKASLEVVKVGETTSTARVVRAVPGRPVVRGDIVANAIYDPERVFKFLVHGRFDWDQDGIATESEADYIRRLVDEWGGEVVEGDRIRGDLDFLVLGEQPPRPTPLSQNATERELRNWIRLNEIADRYERLYNEAREASIPVLNANRFFVLIGHTNR